jgi:hypothetical protein
MAKRSGRLRYGAVLLVSAGLLLFVFRLELLFAFQRMQLSKLVDNDKIWAHRVNSYERFNYLKDHFPGLETDVVFDRSINNFRIYHPPAAQTGLTLDVYLKELKHLEKSLWIDVKGIDTAYYGQALVYFKQYDSAWGIKPYVIIESPDANFVNLMAANGFTASWAAPLRLLQAGGLTDPLNAQVSFVSAEDKYIPLLKKYFPRRKIITWALSFNNYFDLSHIRELVADSSIRVVLVNCKSKGYR